MNARKTRMRQRAQELADAARASAAYWQARADETKGKRNARMLHAAAVCAVFDAEVQALALYTFAQE